MQSDNGALEFDAYINNEKLIGSVDEMEKRVKGFSNSTVREGEKIDDVFKVTAENIKIQKDVIANLENQLKTLNSEIGKLSPGKAQYDLKQQAAQVEVELNGEINALKYLESQVESTTQTHESLRGKLIALRDEMIKMEEAGLRDTEAYQELSKQAGVLKDSIGDAQQQMKILADDEKMFKGIVSTISGITGAFSAAQGAVGLFAGENENLNKIMLKVQSLMAITIGLQQVAEMLNKDSYFSVVILTKAKEMMAAAELKLATAMGVSTVAARVLMATLTLGLSVAITAIVIGISKLASKSAEAKKAQEEFNKAAADAAYKPVASIHQLSTEWKSLGDNVKSKEKFIEDNAKKFDELGVSIANVNDAEKLLVDNKDKFIEAMMNRAKAMAAAEMATNKYKDIIEKQLELEKTPKTVTYRQAITGASGIVVGQEVKTKDNTRYKDLEEEISKIEAEANNLFKLQTKFSDTEKEILKSIGIDSNNIIEGSIAAIEDSISKLREKYKEAANDKDRQAISNQIIAQEKLLEKLDVYQQSKDKTKDKTTDLDKFKNELKEKKEAYDEFEAYRKVAGDDTINEFYSDLIKGGNTYKEYLEKLYASLPKGKKQAAVASELSSFGQGDQKEDNSNKEYLNNILSETSTYNQKRIALEFTYQQKLNALIKARAKENIAQLDKQHKEEMDALEADNLKKSESYRWVYDNIDKLGRKALQYYIARLKKEIDAFKGNEEVKLELTKKLAEAEEKLNVYTPDKLKEGAGLLQEMSGLAGEFNAELAEALNNVAGIASGLATAMAGFGTGNILQGLGGVVGIVTSISKLFGKDGESGSQRLTKWIEQLVKVLELQENALALLSSKAQINEYTVLLNNASNSLDAIESKTNRTLKRMFSLGLGIGDNFKKIFESANISSDASTWTSDDWLKAISASTGDYKKQLESLYAEWIELQKKQQEYINSQNELITGTTYDSIVSSITDGFSDGLDSAADFADTFEDMMRKAMLQSLSVNYLEGKVQDWYNLFAAYNKDGVLTAEEKEALKKSWDLLINGANDYADALEEATGITIASADGSSPEALSGAIKGASEEEVSLLSGYINAVRINQMDSINIMRNQLLSLDKIANNTSYCSNLELLKSIDNRLQTIQNGNLRYMG